MMIIDIPQGFDARRVAVPSGRAIARAKKAMRASFSVLTD